MPVKFEWDAAKARRNRRTHGVTFEQAALASTDKFQVEWIDERESYGEERVILLGMSRGHLLYVVYTERADSVRIISARRATRHEQDLYYRHQTSS